MNKQQSEYNSFMEKFVKNICEIKKEYDNLSPEVKSAVDLDMSKTIDTCGIIKTFEYLIKQYS